MQESSVDLRVNVHMGAVRLVFGYPITRKTMFDMVGYPRGHKGADLKSAVSACIRPGGSNPSPIAMQSKGFLQLQLKNFIMVRVVQLVEHRIVIPSVAGSSPVSHPIIVTYSNLKLSQPFFCDVV